MKEKKEADDLRLQAEMDRKRKDLLQLKAKLDHNSEVLRARYVKKQVDEKQKNEILKFEKNEIQERGENPEFYMIRKQKMEEYEKLKEAHLMLERQNRTEIVKKISKENELMQKKKQLYPNLFDIKKPFLQPTAEEKLQKSYRKLKQIADTCDLSDEEMRALSPGHTSDTGNEPDRSDAVSVCISSTTVASKEPDEESDFDELDREEECLVKPEFEGLWNKQFVKYDAEELYSKKQKFPAYFKTKMEREIFTKTLDKLKQSAIKDQVVGGRKFTGVSFKSNPKIIHFKDFDVGEKYTMKIILTNISYTITTCKLISLTEKLKDFIAIEFQPPGQLSAGLQCEFSVTFEPKINEDLDGEIQFMATNGPFTVPILCTTKKCDVAVNMTTINFSTIVIAEVLNKKIELTNKGALGTNYKLLNRKDAAKSQKPDATDPLEPTKTVEVVEIDQKKSEITIGSVSCAVSMDCMDK
jgi:hypothetical protein